MEKYSTSLIIKDVVIKWDYINYCWKLYKGGPPRKTELYSEGQAPYTTGLPC